MELSPKNYGRLAYLKRQLARQERVEVVETERRARRVQRAQKKPQVVVPQAKDITPYLGEQRVFAGKTYRVVNLEVMTSSVEDRAWGKVTTPHKVTAAVSLTQPALADRINPSRYSEDAMTLRVPGFRGQR